MSYTGLGGTEDISKDLLDLGLKKADEVLGTHVPLKAKKAYALAFAMARTQAKKALSHPTAQEAFNIADDIVKAGSTAFGFAKNIATGKYTADASGVVAFSGDLQKNLMAFAEFARAVGMSQPGMSTAISTAGIATGCAAGVASGMAAGPVGAIAGGVSCAFQLVMNLVSLFFNKVEVLPPGDPRAIFFTDKERTAQAIIDAMRLAKLLKTYYGVSSYSQLKSRMMDIPSKPPQCYLFSECLDRGGSGYPARGSRNKKLPAVDLHWILMAMQPRGNRWDNIRDAFSVIERGRAKAEWTAAPSLTQRRLWHRYYDDNDINVPAIELGAFLARSAIAARGTPISNVRIRELKWGPASYADWEKTDFEPFMHVDELLNFFVAVTIQEIREGLNPVAPYDAAFPVAWRVVCDHTRAGDPETCKPGFSEDYWTNLFPHQYRKQIVAGVKAMNVSALKQFAVVRLCAAWSYMHMLFNWTFASGQQDIVAMTSAPAGADPFFELLAPVDPRQAFLGAGGVWHNRPGDVLSTTRGDWTSPSLGAGSHYNAVVRDVRATNTRADGFNLAHIIVKHAGEIGDAFRKGQQAGTQQAVYELWQQFKEPTSSGLTSIAQQSNLWQQAITSGKIAMFIRPDLMPADMAPPALVPGASVPAGVQPPTPPVQQPTAGVGVLPIMALAGLVLFLMR